MPISRFELETLAWPECNLISTMLYRLSYTGLVLFLRLFNLTLHVTKANFQYAT